MKKLFIFYTTSSLSSSIIKQRGNPNKEKKEKEKEKERKEAVYFWEPANPGKFVMDSSLN